MIVRSSASRLDWTVIQYCHNFSIPCLPRERSSCTFGINLRLLKTAHEGLILSACRSCALLAQQLSGKCVYWGETSFTTARPLLPAMCFVGKCFPQEITYHDVQGVPFVLKSEHK